MEALDFEKKNHIYQNIFLAFEKHYVDYDGITVCESDTATSGSGSVRMDEPASFPSTIPNYPVMLGQDDVVSVGPVIPQYSVMPKLELGHEEDDAISVSSSGGVPQQAPIPTPKSAKSAKVKRTSPPETPPSKRSNKNSAIELQQGQPK